MLKETVSFYSHIKLVLERAVKAQLQPAFPWLFQVYVALEDTTTHLAMPWNSSMAGGKLGIPRLIKDQTNPSVVLYQSLLLPVRVRTQIWGGQRLLSQSRAKRSCTGAMLSLLLKSSILDSFNESCQLNHWGLVKLPSPCACSNLAAAGTTCLVEPELCKSHVFLPALGWWRGKEPEVGGSSSHS